MAQEDRDEEMLNRSGIYKITCTANGRIYIGSAVKFSARWAIHEHQAQKGRHHSKHLQRAWSKHGETAFRFDVMLICTKKDLLMYEQRAIDVLKPEFNASPTAGSTLGLKHTEAQKQANSDRCKLIHGTPEARAKMSAAAKARFADADFKKMHSEKVKERLANTPKEVLKAKYTPEVKNRLRTSALSRAKVYLVSGEYLAARDIAVRYGVSRVQFRARMRRGWSVEKAATTPTNSKHTKLGARVHEYNGILHTLEELVPLSHCSKTALWRRLKAGVSVSQAVEMTPEQAEARRRSLCMEVRRPT